MTTNLVNNVSQHFVLGHDSRDRSLSLMIKTQATFHLLDHRNRRGTNGHQETLYQLVSIITHCHIHRWFLLCIVLYMEDECEEFFSSCPAPANLAEVERKTKEFIGTHEGKKPVVLVTVSERCS